MARDLQKNIIREIHSLPTLPTTFSRINRLIRNSATSAIDIAAVIRQDQVLTARLLKLVNSAFYGFPSKIRTVDHAVVVLGFQSIKNLVLSCSVMEQFKDKTPSALFKHAAFWEHALATAMAARLIGRQCHYPDPEECFVGGLLHDIGKLVHDQYLHARFHEALKMARERRVLIREAEEHLLGMDHAGTGRLLAEQWKLPVELTETIACHHQVETSQVNPLLVSVVHVADIFCRTLQLGDPGDPFVPQISDFAWERLHLPLASVDGLLEKLMEEAQEIKSFLSITSAG